MDLNRSEDFKFISGLSWKADGHLIVPVTSKCEFLSLSAVCCLPEIAIFCSNTSLVFLPLFFSISFYSSLPLPLLSLSLFLTSFLPPPLSSLSFISPCHFCLPFLIPPLSLFSSSNLPPLYISYLTLVYFSFPLSSILSKSEKRRCKLTTNLTTPFEQHISLCP